MATLKSKRKQQAEIEELTAMVEESTPEVFEDIPVESPYLNDAEQTALAEQHEKDTEESKRVSIAKMERVVEVVQEQFNLYDKNFSVNGFADKGSKCQLSMSNGDFDIVVTIKDCEKFGLL